MKCSTRLMKLRSSHSRQAIRQPGSTGEARTDDNGRDTHQGIYDAPASTDGKRVLVDRIWPRGVSKEFAKLDLWLKEVADRKSTRLNSSHYCAARMPFST